MTAVISHSRMVEAIAEAARGKTTEYLVNTRAEGYLYRMSGHLPAMWQDVMQAIELVLRERCTSRGDVRRCEIGGCTHPGTNRYAGADVCDCCVQVADKIAETSRQYDDPEWWRD